MLVNVDVQSKHTLRNDAIATLFLFFYLFLMISTIFENLGIFLNVIVLIFAIAMAIVPLRWDIVVRDQNGAIKKFTTPGTFFVLFSLCALGFGIWKIINDDKDSQASKAAVATLNSQLSSLNTKLDEQEANNESLHSDYEDLDSLYNDLNSKNADIARIVGKPLQDPSNPHLYLCPFIPDKSSNPYMHPSNIDSVHCDFSLCNDGSGVAVHLIGKEVGINYRSGKPRFWTAKSSILNESTEIGVNQPGLLIPMLLSKPHDFDVSESTFIFFSIYYESESGEKKKTFRKIFTVTEDHQMREVSAEQFSSLKIDLKKASYW